MMKLSSKSMSSPSRTDKYPPPLMRFMRAHVSSKSRGRSRASPMFIRKKNTTASIETQEPSSPKVTCIGQVQSRRSKKPNQVQGNGRCHCVRNALFCRNFNGKVKNQSSDTNPRRWVSFFRNGFRKRSEVGGNGKACGFESRCREKEEEEQSEIENDDDDEKLMCASFTPPKNALILTRSRSTPYRSSSLASRFWEEEEEPEKTEHRNNIVQHQSQLHHVGKNDNPTLGSDPNCRDSAPESMSDHESEESEKLCSEIESAKCIEKTGEVCSVLGPVMLTRCKSEPGSRTWEKIHPESMYVREIVKCD